MGVVCICCVRLCASVLDQHRLMLSYMYDEAPHADINKVFAHEIGDFLEELGLQKIRQHFWADTGSNHLHTSAVEQLADKYGHSNFFISGAEYVFVKPRGWEYSQKVDRMLHELPTADMEPLDALQRLQQVDS